MGSTELAVIKRTLTLLESNAGDIASAGLMPAIIAMVVALMACLGVVVALKRLGTQNGTFRAVSVALLSMNMLLLVLPAVGVGVATPYAVEEAIDVLSAEAAELGLETPVGLLLLAPLVEVYTREGQDEAALERLEGPSGPTLTAFTDPAVRTQALDRLTPEAIEGVVSALRREIAIPDTAIPPRLVALALDRGQAALTRSADIYPDLLDAMETAGPRLAPRQAAQQVGRRFFERHAQTLGQRAMDNDPIALIIFSLGQFLLLAAALGALGRLVKAD